MAMLAEPRRRKRYNLCPRGKALYEDDTRFGTKMLEKMGWSKGRGLGANEDGSQEFVRVRFKNDAEGLGYEMRDDQWTTHEEGFNGLLKALNGEGDNADEANGNGSASEEEARPMGFGFQPAAVEETKPKTLKENISGISLEEKSKHSKARVHYKKFTRGKDLAQYSEKDLANIFGKKATEEIEAPVQIEEQPEEEGNPVNPNFAGVQTVATGLSVSDYFKQKMEAMKQKLANNQNTDSAAAPKTNPFKDESAADPEEEPAKKKKKKKDKKREEELSYVETVQPEEPAAEQKKKKKSKRPAEEDTAELENKELATEETNPPKRKKKKKDKQEPTEEVKVAEEATPLAAAAVDGEAEPKKKKKSKKIEEISIEAPEETELNEKPAKKKSKKSKKGELEEADLKEEKEEAVKEPERPESFKETESNEETTSKTKKKKSKTKAPKVESDAAEEQQPPPAEKKKKESKKHATEVSANPIDIECSSDDSDSPAANQSGEYLSTEQLAAKLDSYNVFAISSFCAEKFHILNMNAFKNASLAQINGYSYDENIRLEVVEATMDAQRITSLWEGKTIKYMFTRRVASKYKFKRVEPADIKKINRVKAFSGL